MWNEKGIEVHLFEEGSFMSQVVFSEHVPHFICVFPKTRVLECVHSPWPEDLEHCITQ